MNINKVNNLPTVKEALANKALRDRLAAEVLTPKPWKHSSYLDSKIEVRSTETGWTRLLGEGVQVNICAKCGHEVQFTYSKDRHMHVQDESASPCTVPDPLDGSEADTAEALVAFCYKRHGFSIEDAIRVISGLGNVGYLRCLEWFVWQATSAQRIVTLLLGLGKVRLSDE